MSRTHDADRTVDRLLRQAGEADSAAGGPGPCLDAETLAAWVDGGLRPQEVRAAETHAAGCSRCQSTVAALIKHTPAADPARDRVAWPWGLRWIVPLAAGAAAVGLWFAVPRPAPPAGDRPSAATARVEMPAPTPVSPPAIALPGERAQIAEAASPSRDRLATPGQERSGAADAPAKMEAADAPRRDEQVPATPEQASRQRAAPASLNAVGRTAAEAPPVPGAKPSGTALPAAAPARAVASGVEATPTRLVTSPDPSVRWRVGAGGSVEFSPDGGASWQPQASGVTADLTTGSAPSPSVCWVAGRAGSIVRTEDAGRTWVRVTFPVAADLVLVRATDSSTAEVTTSDGRVYRTTDAGRTWR